MSSIIKVILLLAVIACVSVAQHNEAGENCLCKSVKNGFINKSQLKDVQFYKASTFCDKLEIVVTNNNGFRYCLNPDLKIVKQLLAKLMSRRNQSTSSTARPTKPTSSPVSTNAAHI